MNKRLTNILVFICACVFLLGTAAVVAMSAEEGSSFFNAGQFFKKANENNISNQSGEILAKYQGVAVTRTMVDYQRNMNILRSEDAIQENTTDLDIVNNILKSIMLLEEAEQQGLAATPDEVEALVENARLAYSLPEGKQILDDFCAGSGITVEEYFEIYRQQLPRTIARQKLMDAVGKQYCEANGLTFTKVNPPAELVAAQEEYIQALFQQNQSKIEYFLDVVS